MCVNYLPVSRNTLEEMFEAPVQTGASWPDETYQDYLAPIILPDEAGRRIAVAASYGMVPKSQMPPGAKHFATMNARSETVGQLRSYASAWRAQQLCLVPMTAFYEPNWETGRHVRWRIGMADDAPFAVAGLYRRWREGEGSGYSFTQLTVNADAHPLMRRFHKPGDEKRSLVIVPWRDYDAWLSCRNPEEARSFLSLYPADAMAARPEPRLATKPMLRAAASSVPVNGDLF
ncbi:SOS response-associated peptidase [Noviherbaspirillum pedocola]|uniref:Abasic site processing protein n=1 Tax=Noviherbaspirillum pedocola TaxID=2801341 RepID=A0A934SWQ7_9BURK|nr:SOS response-associated peptidase family protein [Noviherbaspirillum pedocola]MBK4737985.1 SOS response-associated peptidase family protein [Noviherbaspirillum pedocola]